MTFGQQLGPPASTRQVHELLALLHAAGHAGFRDARGPLGFTQRQAAGKFTREEAAAYIERLEEEAEEADSVPEGVAHPASTPPSASEDRATRLASSEQLAAELRRRGWTVHEPPQPPAGSTRRRPLRLVRDS
jgi:hypothetical protein